MCIPRASLWTRLLQGIGCQLGRTEHGKKERKNQTGSECSAQGGQILEEKCPDD
jgi:hypothetical protein